MAGKLPRCGIGDPVNAEKDVSYDSLLKQKVVHNKHLLKHLAEEEKSEWLFQDTVADAEKKRMSYPVPVTEEHINSFLMQPRFVLQQQRSDGAIKYRAIDHLSWSPGHGKKRKAGSVNGATVVEDKIQHDTLDELLDAMQLFVEVTHEIPCMFKADIDSAFRRVPVQPWFRQFCGVVFRHQGRVFFSHHFALPFGALASVLAWERIGAAILHIGAVILMSSHVSIRRRLFWF